MWGPTISFVSLPYEWDTFDADLDPEYETDVIILIKVRAQWLETLSETARHDGNRSHAY